MIFLLFGSMQNYLSGKEILSHILYQDRQLFSQFFPLKARYMEPHKMNYKSIIFKDICLLSSIRQILGYMEKHI